MYGTEAGDQSWRWSGFGTQICGGILRMPKVKRSSKTTQAGEITTHQLCLASSANGLRFRVLGFRDETVLEHSNRPLLVALVSNIGYTFDGDEVLWPTVITRRLGTPLVHLLGRNSTSIK